MFPIILFQTPSIPPPCSEVFRLKKKVVRISQNDGFGGWWEKIKVEAAKSGWDKYRNVILFVIS